MVHFSNLTVEAPRNGKRFREFITEVRNHLRRPTDLGQEPLRTINDVPALPRRPNWFLKLEIHVRGVENQCCLLIRESDLYLLGFSIGNVLYKLNDADDDLVVEDGTVEVLPFGSSYGDLARAANLSSTSMALVGRNILFSSLMCLSTVGSSYTEIATALNALTIMLCEASRFRNIERFISKSFKGDRVFPDLTKWTKRWSKLSKQISKRTVSWDDKQNVALMKP